MTFPGDMLGLALPFNLDKYLEPSIVRGHRGDLGLISSHFHYRFKIHKLRCDIPVSHL